MPLPAMMNAPDQMLAGPGMSAGATGTGQPGDQTVNPREQVRGGIQALAQLRKSVGDQLSAVAGQFPTASEDAQGLQQALDQGIQRIMKKLLLTVQQPEPEAPAILR